MQHTPFITLVLEVQIFLNYWSFLIGCVCCFLLVREQGRGPSCKDQLLNIGNQKLYYNRILLKTVNTHNSLFSLKQHWNCINESQRFYALPIRIHNTEYFWLSYTGFIYQTRVFIRFVLTWNRKNPSLHKHRKLSIL